MKPVPDHSAPSARQSSNRQIKGRGTIDTVSKRIPSTTDGSELAYWLQHPDSHGDRLLLLIHGAASNHTRWSEFVEHTTLTTDWTVIYPDMRGNGASMTRGKQDMPAWCADLADILNAEGASNAVIVGHSLGAQIAVNFAHRYPGKVRGLVLIDPVFQRALKGRQLLVRRYRWVLQGLGVVIRALNAIGVRRRHIGDRDLRELDQQTRQAIARHESIDVISKRYGALGPILRHMPTANYVRQALATVSELPDPATIDVPVQVLISGATTLADLDVNRAEASRFPDCEIVLLEANHWPLTETPEAVREAIEGWVSRTFPA
ncbi:MAG: alpha/beta hydrolase [Chromatiales bacterium]